MANPYTLGVYRVKPGQQEEFIAAWRNLAKVFATLPDPPIAGTLIRHATDRTLFYSFGPWHEPAHIKAMRSNANVQTAFQRIAETCNDMTPGDFELVEHIDLEAQSRVGAALKRSDPRAGNRRTRG